MTHLNENDHVFDVLAVPRRERFEQLEAGAVWIYVDVDCRPISRGLLVSVLTSIKALRW